MTSELNNFKALNLYAARMTPTNPILVTLNRGSYMSAHVVLNLLNKMRNSDKMPEFCGAFYRFFATC